MLGVAGAFVRPALARRGPLRVGDGELMHADGVAELHGDCLPGALRQRAVGDHANLVDEAWQNPRARVVSETGQAAYLNFARPGAPGEAIHPDELSQETSDLEARDLQKGAGLYRMASESGSRDASSARFRGGSVGGEVDDMRP